MGLWTTGYLEFHELTGLGGDYVPPKPVKHCCSQCNKKFPDFISLSLHRFEEHPFHQPILIIDGIEFVSSKHAISKEISTSKIHCLNTTTCWVNGSEMSINSFVNRLATMRSGFVNIRLHNAIGEVETCYDIEIAIPEQDDIAEVDKRFFEFSSMGNLNVLSINKFIDITNKFKSTKKYVDGLSSYLYAVLAKDGRGDILLSKEEGRARMTHAIQILGGFDTALSNVISEIINLNLNVFSTDLGLTTAPQLAIVMQKFCNLLYENKFPSSEKLQSDDLSFKQIPLDICTNQIMEWSLMPSERIVEQRKTIEKVLHDDAWVPDDRLKVHIILANAYKEQGDFRGCVEHARKIRHNPFWGDWAESLIKISN